MLKLLELIKIHKFLFHYTVLPYFPVESYGDGFISIKKKRKTFQGGKNQLQWWQKSISTVVKINFKRIMLFCRQLPTH